MVLFLTRSQIETAQNPKLARFPLHVRQGRHHLNLDVIESKMSPNWQKMALESKIKTGKNLNLPVGLSWQSIEGARIKKTKLGIDYVVFRGQLIPQNSIRRHND